MEKRDYEVYSRRRLEVRKHKYPWRIWAYVLWLADVIPDSLAIPLIGGTVLGTIGLIFLSLLALDWILEAHTWFSWILVGVLLSWGLRFLGRLGQAYIREALEAEQYYRRDDDAE